MNNIASLLIVLTLFFFSVNLSIAQNNDIFSAQQNNDEVFANREVKKAPSESKKNKKIGLKFEQISVTDFFKVLSDFYEVKFVISEEANMIITIDIDDMTLDESINVVEKATGLKIVNNSNTYIVKKMNVSGCNYNGNFYPIKTIKTINNKTYYCDIEKIDGDVFTQEKVVTWQLFDN